MSELREIDKETRRARGAMLYKECRSCQDIRKILDENKVLLDQSIIDSSVGLFLGRDVLTLLGILGLFAGKYLRIFLCVKPRR